MNFREFEAALNLIERDRRLMSQGDNQSVVNAVMSMVLSIQHLQRAINGDQLGKELSFLLGNKLSELESVLMSGSYQILSERGVNLLNHVGQRQRPGPGNAPVRISPQTTYVQQPAAAVRPQYTPPVTGSADSKAVRAEAPRAPERPEANDSVADTAPAPVSAPAPKASSAYDDDFVLPGLGGDQSGKPAAGRDFLLDLLKES